MIGSVLDTAQAPARSSQSGSIAAAPRPSDPCRRFTLLDAMILTAATAVGMSLSRLLVPGLKPLDLIKNYRLLTGFSSPILASWGLAWLVLRLRGPRPRFRRLMRQPGMIGCIAAAAILAIRWGCEPIVMLLAGRGDTFFRSEQIWPAHCFVGPAVFAAWLTLALGGRRRPERGWLDRTGRAIGVGWVALFVLTMGLIVQHEWRSAKRAPRRPRPAVKRVATTNVQGGASHPGIVDQPKGLVAQR